MSSSPEASSGYLFAFEGIDGAGKTELSREIQNRLMALGEAAVFSPFVSDENRYYWDAYRKVLPEGDKCISPEHDQVIHTMNMIAQTDLFFREKASSYSYVLADRYIMSRIALARLDNDQYETAAERLIRNAATDNVVRNPDVTFYLDIEPELARQRIERSRPLCSQEPKEELSQLHRARGHYEDIILTPEYCKLLGSFVVLDGSLPQDELAEQAMQHIQEQN